MRHSLTILPLTLVPTIEGGKVKVNNNAIYGANIAAGFIARLNAYEQSKGRYLFPQGKTLFQI